MNRKSKVIVLVFTLLLAIISMSVVAFAESTPTAASEILEEIAQTPPTLSADGKTVILPSVPSGYTVSIHGTSNSAVIDTAGRIYEPLVDTEVSIMYKVSSVNDPTDIATDEFKEAKIMIEGKYTASASDNKEPAVLPKLREWKGGEGFVSFNENSRIVVSDARFSAVAERAKEYIDAITGFDTEIVFSDNSLSGDIVIEYADKAELGPEGYTLAITDRVRIGAYAETGALYGATTVAQMLDIYEGFALPKGEARDYPQYEVRAVMLDVARHYIPMKDLIEMTKYMAYFKVNTIHVHINDTGGQQPYSFRVESKKFPEINANLNGNYYTQDEYRAYQRDMLSYGIKVITEIDSPGHAGFAGAYDKTLVAPSNTSFLNLSTEIHSTVDGVSYTYYDKAVEFMKELIGEFVGGDDPVVIGEIDTFHLGMDEYTLDHEQFKVYMKEMTEFVQSNGKKVQVWSALKTADFSAELPIGTDVTVNYWGFADFDKLIENGFPCVANKPMDLYVVPGGFANSFGDRINLESLYEKYSVNIINDKITLAESSPILRGMEAALWNDTNVAASIQDLFDRLHDQILLVSEKAWYGKNAEDATVDEFMARVHKFENSVPLVNPSRFVEGDENGKVAEYDFNSVSGNTVKDENGLYDATLNNLNVVNYGNNAMLSLNGNGYISLPFDYVGSPYTVSFDLLYEGSESGTLFEADGSWIKINFNGTGKIAYKRDMQTYTLPHVFSEGILYSIKLVCDGKDLNLYVNGIYAGKGQIYSMDTVNQSTNYIAFTTITLPTEKIGAGVNGLFGNLKILNYAEEYEKLVGLDLVNYGNVALGKEVSASGVEVTTKWGPECAVDGILKADDNNNKTSLNNAHNAWLTIDLGAVYNVEKIVIEFSERPNIYQFWTSVDGVEWEMVHEESELPGKSGGTDTVMLNDKEVRFVKYQTVEMFYNGRYYYSGGFHEIMVYSSYYDTKILDRAEALLAELSGNNKTFLSESIALVKYIISNNDYSDVGVALKALSDACDKLENDGFIASSANRSAIVSLIKNKRNADLYSSDSFNAYNEAYRFALGTALNPSVNDDAIDLYKSRLEKAAMNLLCTAEIETNMSFDNPQTMLDGSTDTHAQTSENQKAGDFITVKFEEGIELKSIKLVMLGTSKFLAASTFYVSYDGTTFIPVTTLNTSLAESNIVIGGSTADAEIFFPTTLTGIKAIKFVVNIDKANIAYINEIHINHVTDFNTIVNGIADIKEEDYTEASIKNLLPYTRSMAVSSNYMSRANTFIRYLVKRADTEAIETEINRLLAIDSSKYTAASYLRLTNAINAARSFISSVNANSDIYDSDAEIAKLRYAEDMLREKTELADTAALEAAINDVVSANKYTYYSYTAYKSALDAAVELLYSDYFTQDAVDEALAKLIAKKNALVNRTHEENLALGKEVTASGLDGSAFDINATVDGVDTTIFANRVGLNNADDAWLTVNLGGTYVIDRVNLHWYSQPAKYAILVSTDNVSWTTVYITEHNEKMGKAIVDTIYFEPIEAKYVKFQQIMMYVGNAEKNYRYSGNICEIKVFGADMTPYTASLLDKYNALGALDTGAMHPDCAAELIAALAEAERVLALTSPTQAEIDAAEKLLKAHSPLSYTTVNGQLSFECECGRSDVKTPIKLDAAKLKLNESINMIYLFTVEGNVENIKVCFNFKGKAYEVTAYTVEADGRYSFRFDKIMPQYMNDRLTATVYAVIDGVEVMLDCGGISVKEYAQMLLEAYPDNEKLVSLVSDLIAYGDAAQIYTGYDANNLASSGLNITPSDFNLPTSKLTVTESSSITSIASAGLKLTGDVSMYFTFSATDTESLIAKVTINGRTKAYDVSAMTPEANGNYKIYFENIMAHEMDDTVTLTFEKDGVDIGNRVTYSINSYISVMYANSNPSLASLVKALCCYGESAKAYR